MELLSEIPTTLSAEIAETYDMSIRLMSDGLIFSLSPCDKKIIEDEQKVYKSTYLLEQGAENYCSAVKELFFHHQHLTLPYHHVHIAYQPDSYVLIPRALYEEGRGDYWLRTAVQLNDEKKEMAIMEYNLTHQDKMLILAWDKPLYEFLQRTQVGTVFSPDFAPFLLETERKSRQHSGKRIAINLRKEKMDIFVFEGGSIFFANSYTITDDSNIQTISEEMLFYLITIWKSLKLNAQSDQIVICMPQAYIESTLWKEDLLKAVKPFFYHIEIIESPSLSYIFT